MEDKDLKMQIGRDWEIKISNHTSDQNISCPKMLVVFSCVENK